MPTAQHLGAGETLNIYLGCVRTESRPAKFLSSLASPSTQKGILLALRGCPLSGCLCRTVAFKAVKQSGLLGISAYCNDHCTVLENGKWKPWWKFLEFAATKFRNIV